MSVDHKELRRLAQAATPGPWVLGDRWHVQGASHCKCLRGKLIYDGPLDINGEMMRAHVHEFDEPRWEHGIFTRPNERGEFYSVIYTTGEYGHPEREDEEFIAAANPQTILALLDEIEHLKREVNYLTTGGEE